MSTTVGVREFRQSLAEFIDQTEPVTITRHGQTVGLFIPVHRDRKAEIAAYAEAARKANALLAEWGVTEDEVVAEFDALRRAGREAEQSA
ncbi:type II toxin-antitoxin system Phd/YefM family antitoxin [Tessaracoccus caeni]|uniref:type II toxin-antitoxin system Phd/YefM family antitoxin n=1 Tax=Tessaracoccus caeni TaxID=3031239 RepID=UPI0023DC18D2|nr:hypothetical protein [Tessaracoccus caeni]MDF1487706.1 hypothetical protein [Tessaracoccus caeni]